MSRRGNTDFLVMQKEGVIMRTRFIPYSLVFMILGLLAPTLQASEFPGRPKYPDVKTIELAELNKHFDQHVIIDARSSYEFDTLHIKGSVNVPISSEEFARRVRDLSDLTKKPLVFYCNGHTCMKSYKAARAARLAGVKNCYAYDAGMFDWAKAHPAKTVLLGKPLKSPSQLIPKSTLKKHTLEPKEFAAYAENKKHFVTIDVRSRYQRAGVGLFPFIEQWISLEQTLSLDKAIKDAAADNKTLLIYDEVGKQVRWLQYRLEEMGVKKYYFMKGGAAGYIESIK